MPKKSLSAAERDDLLSILRSRFEKNVSRHTGIDWTQVEAKIKGSPEKLWSLSEMERTGGEPDVVIFEKTNEITFVDCSAESPKGRRSLCYDRKAWESRKEHKPAGDAVTTATSMGITLLSEDQYRELQELGEVDLKTSSWVATPPEVRDLGGAIFCDRRFGRVFTYHNGAESYYGVRGFRGMLRA